MIKDIYIKIKLIIKKIFRAVKIMFKVIKKINFKKIKKGILYIKKYGFINLMKKIKNHYRNISNSVDMLSDYKLWIKNNEPTCKDLEEQKKFKFKYNPKISIVVPMYNTPETFFCDLINCLKNQTYSNFELCLADGSKEKAEFIDKYISDDRIKYKLLHVNGGISYNSNEALKMTTGDYIALLDHDDILPIFCLFEIVKCINENMDVEFIYTDEDKIMLSNDDRYDPHFKPDFSPDLLTSYNYITHLSIFKRQLIDKIGNFDSKYDGAQDYDIILRATENTKKIIHLPKILYHWRVHANSTAMSSESKLYAYDAGKLAIEQHFERINIKCIVEHEQNLGIYRVKYTLEDMPLISIIIPNKDNYIDLKKCINSILKLTYKNYEIIIIENNSKDHKIFKYYDKISKNNDNIKVVNYKETGFNFSKINNFGIKYAKGKYLLLLNNDVEIINKNMLEEMLGICQRSDVGIVGAKLFYYDDTVQHAGVVIGIGGIAGHINKLIDRNCIGYYSRASVINNYSAVTAACMLIKKELFDKVNGFDENLKVAFNDIDLCLKVRKLNYLVVYTPYAKLYHFESKSRGLENTPEKIQRFESEINIFREKWNDIIKNGDPYFNINFRLDMPVYYINSNKIKS